MIRRPPRSTRKESSAASDVYKRQANITVTPGSDLTIGKSRSVSGNLLIGQTFNFILKPSYSGGVPDTITVTDAIPSNYTIGVVPASQNGWTCSVAGQIVTCTRPSGGVAGLNQQLGDISIPVTVATAGSVTNTASINAVTTDPVSYTHLTLPTTPYV